MPSFRRRKSRPNPKGLSIGEEARLRLAAIVESSDDAIISKDLNGIITSWNASATRLFGYQPDEIIGKSVLTLIPPDLQDQEPVILQRLRGGERIDHFETQRLRKDGTIFDVSLTISPIKDTSGRVIGSSKIARDISDRKRAEAALIQSERLAAIGRMAGAIAHEVNNPLEAITNLAYLLTHHPSLDDEARGFARMLLDEVGRASRITKQTLAFYRDTAGPAAVKMSDLLDNILELHRPLMMKKNIHVRKAFCDPAATVRGFGAELRQVFANLILNAIDAVPPGGMLWVKVSHHGASGDNSGEVRVAIADNGCGIPHSRRHRVFEPFFTTKADRGTGLGLWVSDGIVRKHGGRIRVNSSTRPGHSGTVFTVILPAHAEEAQKTSAA
jgi:PAS domain S-box-containing protein